MGIKITDLVDQQAMQQLADLGTRFDDIKAKYVQIANELINGINIKVTVIGDLEKLDNLVRTQSRQLIDTSKQLTAAVEEEQKVLKRTTATIAEQLQKNAQYNAKKRENINIDKEAMQIAKDLLGSYAQRSEEYTNAIRLEKEARQSISELNKSYKDGNMSVQEYEAKLDELQKSLRKVTAEKKELQKSMAIEERLNATATGSYDNLRQQLEFYKTALKQIPQDALASPEEQERIQRLRDAVSALVTELKYQGELMGEHQMNVGNYASAMDGAGVNVKEVNRYLDEYRVATTNGIASTDEITRVLGIEATTTEQLIAQNKALDLARKQVDQTQEGSKDIIDQINAKLTENKLRLLDVDGVMQKQVTTIAEAKEQNATLAKAQELLNTTTEDGKAKFLELGQRITENKKFIEDHKAAVIADEETGKKFQITAESVAAALTDQAKSVAEAKEQNKLLKAAIDQIVVSSDDAKEKQELFRAKIEENERFITSFTGELQKNASASGEQKSAIELANEALHVQASSIAEAEAQNKLFEQAIKSVDVTQVNAIDQINAYASAIDRNTAMIDQFNGKLFINESVAKKAENALKDNVQTVTQAEKQNEILAEAITNVNKNAQGATEKIQQYNAKIKENEKIINENKEAWTGLVEVIMKMFGVNVKFGGSLQQINDSLSKGGNAFTGLATKVRAFGNSLIAVATNPYVLAFMAAVGVVAAIYKGVKAWKEYNDEMVEASRLTKYYTGLTGDAMRSVRDNVRATADTFDQDFTATLRAANAVAKNMGTTVDEATDLIAKGFAAGGVNSQNFLFNLERYAPTFQKMGVDAEHFIAMMSQIDKSGVNSSRALTAMSKASLQLRTMNLKTSESLKAIGVDASAMTKAIQTGSKDTIDAMSEIATKIKETGTNSREVSAVMKELFGARGESAIGDGFLEFLANANTGMEELLGKEGSLQRLKLEEKETDEELNNVIAAMFDMTGGGYEEITTKCKIWIKQGLILAINKIGEMINGFVEWYNSSETLRMAIWGVVAVVRVLIVIQQSLQKIVVSAFKSIFYAIESVINKAKALGHMLMSIKTLFTDGIDAAKAQFNAALKEMGASFKADFTAVKDAAGSIASIYKSAFAEIQSIAGQSFTMAQKKLNYRFNPESIINASTDDGGGGGKPTPPVKDPTEPHAKDSDKKDKHKDKDKDKDDEKAAREALKRLEALEQSKIDLMEDGIEKTLALIKLEYKKKIDAIKGHTAEEEQTRINLAKAMNKELEQAQTQWDNNRLNIDLENRLAAVEEGSEEEYNLKYSKLQMQYAMEILEAKKTGADVNEITKKYQKQGDELTEKYLAKQIDKLQESSATAQIIKDNQLKKELSDLNEQQAIELAMAGTNEEKIAEIKERYAAKVAEVQEQYAIKTAKAQLQSLFDQMTAIGVAEEQADEILKKIGEGKIDEAAAILEAQGLSHDDALNLARSLATAEVEIDDAVTAHKLANIERVTDEATKARDKRIANAEKWLNAAAEACSNITELVTTLFDGQISKIEEQQEANQQQHDAAIANIEDEYNKGLITQEESEIRKREIEEATAKREAELQKKKAQAEYKQALAEKANNISQIVIATSLGIMKASPNWVNMALVAAMGAIQLATAIAQPIKAYKRGTDYHPGGLAIVGDGGKREVVESGGKYWLTPKVPTLVEMPEGSKVFPDYLDFIANEPPVNYGDLLAALPLPDISPLLFAQNAPKVIVNNDYRDLKREMAENNRLLKAMIKQQHRDAARIKYDQYRAERI